VVLYKTCPQADRDLQIATEKQDGWFQVENDRGVLLKVKLRGTKFLSTRWEELFENAVSDIRIIVRVCRRQKLSDAELRNVVFKASDSVRRLSIVAEIIEPFGQFPVLGSKRHKIVSLYG